MGFWLIIGIGLELVVKLCHPEVFNSYVNIQWYIHKNVNIRWYFLEGPEDDCIRVETCYPNTIINIIKFCCFWLTHHCIIIFLWRFYTPVPKCEPVPSIVRLPPALEKTFTNLRCAVFRKWFISSFNIISCALSRRALINYLMMLDFK